MDDTDPFLQDPSPKGSSSDLAANKPYPHFDLYPSDGHGHDDAESSAAAFQDDRHQALSQEYPNVDPYATATMGAAAAPASTHTPKKSLDLNSPSKATPPPTYRASFPGPGTGQKSYVGPKVKAEACCALDEELQKGVQISVSLRVQGGGD